jgi:hypothetical protein
VRDIVDDDTLLQNSSQGPHKTQKIIGNWFDHCRSRQQPRGGGGGEGTAEGWAVETLGTEGL